MAHATVLCVPCWLGSRPQEKVGRGCAIVAVPHRSRDLRGEVRAGEEQGGRVRIAGLVSIAVFGVWRLPEEEVGGGGAIVAVPHIKVPPPLLVSHLCGLNRFHSLATFSMSRT